MPGRTGCPGPRSGPAPRGYGHAHRTGARHREARPASARRAGPCSGLPAAGDRASGARGAVEDEAVATFAVTPPRGDPGDRRGARASLRGDLGVVETLVEQTHHGPAHRQIAQLAQGAQVAEEAPRLFTVLQLEDCVEESVGLVGAPGIVGGHGGRLSGDRSMVGQRRSYATVVAC